MPNSLTSYLMFSSFHWVLQKHSSWIECSIIIEYLIWYYTCFNAILPNHPPTPSSTESKRLFYTSASLLLSRIQGYRYHLSKFHIYALVYCIGVFLLEVGGGFRIGNTCTPVADSCWCMAKPIQYCKVKKKKRKKEKNISVISFSLGTLDVRGLKKIIMTLTWNNPTR